MELRELTHDERLALVALLELVVESDRNPADGEVGEIERVIEALGREDYRQLVAEVDRRFPTEAELRAFLPAIVRQEARDLIYGTALDTAIEDGVDVWESKLLEWLAKLWNVHVEFEDDDPGGDADA
jgi:hypothetical protein